MINKCNPNCAVCQGRCIYTSNNSGTQSMTRACDCYIFYDIKENIMTAELQAIINKPDKWQNSLVQPGETNYYYYISEHERNGLGVMKSSLTTVRKPEHAFKTKEQAELIKEKMLLMQEMYAFAHVKNEGWMPDWQDEGQVKYGVIQIGDVIGFERFTSANPFVFGVTVKSKEIAEEMLEIFGERIKKFYNKQY